jgi:hypothetical protein
MVLETLIYITFQGLMEAEHKNGSAVFEHLYGYFINQHRVNYSDNVFHKHAGSSFLTTMAVTCGETIQYPMDTEEYLA